MSFCGELFGDGLSLIFVNLLIGEKVGEQNAAPVSDSAVGDFAFLA